MIVLQSVYKSYGQVRAVSGVSFAVAPRTATALVGPSGSGKTTVLRLIAGLEEPDEGRVIIDGRTASQPGAMDPPHTRKIGMVFQRPALWPHLTVTRNIAFGLARWRRPEAEARVARVIRLLELDGLESRYPHQLSGGEAQRVALARALAPRPRILLLDEPLSNLDPALYASTLGLIRQVRARSEVTLVLVSHDPSAAASVCEQVVAMRGGCVVQAGTWASVEAHSRAVSTAEMTT